MSLIMWHRLIAISTVQAVVDAACPPPGPGEVRLQVAACGLNFADLLMIKGQYQEKPPLPITLGMEFAGTVTELGAGVDGLGIGMRVAGVAGFVMYLMMWTVALPPENNPVLDDHILGAISVLVLALTLAGDTWGAGKAWARTGLVEKHPVLR